MSGIITRAAAARAFATEALKVRNNVAKQQFVVSMGKANAVLDYEKNGNNIVFLSTEVPKEFQGKGVGKILAQHAFSHAVENKLDVTCKCDFLAKFYTDNQQKYKDLKVKIDLEEEN